MTFEHGFAIFVALALGVPVLVATVLDHIVWERARAAKWRRVRFMDKCKRRRADGPTPCLCCKGECKG